VEASCTSGKKAVATLVSWEILYSVQEKTREFFLPVKGTGASNKSQIPLK